MNASGGGQQGGMPSAQQQQQLFASLQQAMNATQQPQQSQGQMQQPTFNGAGHGVAGMAQQSQAAGGGFGAMMGIFGGGQGVPQQQQQQHHQQHQTPQQMPHSMQQGQGQQGQGNRQAQPNVSAAMQNPAQLLHVINAQIQNLQRQFQTVQQQADSPQKMEAIQHLATQMKRMKMIQAQTLQTTQNRSNEPQQAQQFGQNVASAQNAQQANQTPQQQPHFQQPFQAPTPRASTPQAQNAATPMPQSAPTPQGQPTEAPSPAHNAQLAALQAFAQQQRMQAIQGHASSTTMIPGQGADGNQPWQANQQSQQVGNQQTQQQQQQQQLQSPMAPPQSQPQHGMQHQQNGSGSRPGSSGMPGLQGQQQPGKTDLVAAVRTFMAQRGTPLPPNLPMAFVGPQPGGLPGQAKSIDTQTLFATVIQVGGSARISSQPNGWAIVASKLGLAVAPTPAQHPGQDETDANGTPLPPFVAPRLAQFFKERFGPFEELWLSRTRGGTQGQTPAAQQQSQGQMAVQRPVASGPLPQFPQQGPMMGQQMMPGAAGSPQTNHAGQGFPGRPPQSARPPEQQQMQGPQPPSTPMQQPQQMGQGRPPQGSMPTGVSGAAQEAMRRAGELQSALPQQMQQLQMLVSTGKITQEQAKDRFTSLQNQVRTSMMQAQALVAGSSQTGSGKPTQQNQGQQQNQAMPPPQGMMMPSARPLMQMGMPGGPLPLSTDGHASDMSRPSSSHGGMGPPTQAPHVQQQMRPDTPVDKKPPPKRVRKVTGGSNKTVGGLKSEASDAPSPTPSDARPTSTHQPSPSPANLAQAKQNAQHAAQALNEGILAPPQQVAAFAAIRAAQLQMQNIHGVDVFPAAQVAAQAYGRILTQARHSGSPLPAVAPSAFAAAQQEMARLFPLPPGSQVAPSISAPSPGAASESQGTQVNGSYSKPPKFKVEYMPVRRDVRTCGGWDLDFVEGNLGPLLAGRGRLPRSVRELGEVDIEGLIMSLRSRLDVEVAYALNVILVLSAGVRVPNFQFLLGLCEDLLEELLDLLEETTFANCAGWIESNDTRYDDASIAMPSKCLSQCEWINGALADEDECKLFKRSSRKRQRPIFGEGYASDDDSPRKYGDVDAHFKGMEGDREGAREANRALLIIDIFRNMATIPGNIDFLNEEPRFFKVLMNVVAAAEHAEQAKRESKARKESSEVAGDAPVHVNGNGRHHSPISSCEDSQEAANGLPHILSDNVIAATVFTTSEALRARKDILCILASLGKEKCALNNIDATTVHSIISFLASFIEDADELEDQHGTVFREMLSGSSPRPEMLPVMRKVPFLCDMALEAFSSIGQPDGNRQVLGQLLANDTIVHLCSILIRLLPVSDMDFTMLKTEARLAYCERISMSLFDLVYLGNSAVKQRIKGLPGTKGVFVRCIKRLMRVNPDFSVNPFSVLTRRLVETLRVLNDGEVLFDRPALLGFGMSSSAGTQPDATSLSNGATSGVSTLGTISATSKGPRQATQGSLLINDEAAIVELMAIEGVDPSIVAEFEQML